ncbi:MAG: translation initiation factor IF-3 [Acidimicrobiia bacterium]|nr:translation initiation factor IF-3 [Acidimicrobiia bacterium]
MLISTREPRVNDRIRAKEVRLVAPDGGQIGIKSIDEAKWLAAELGLDLVEVAADARPPVVRMMDYGKFKYEQSVKAREARKKQTRTVIKEVQFRPKIGVSDYEVKRKRVQRFLGEGDKVKCTMRFRGREVTHPELGREILQRLVDDLGERAVVEVMPKMEGRQITMVLGPGKAPTEAPAEAPAEADPQEETTQEVSAADSVDSPESADVAEVTETEQSTETALPDEE